MARGGVVVAVAVALLALAVGRTHAYVAAVSHHVAVEKATPAETLAANVELYRQHVAAAAAEGADILVLPEFGLGGDFSSRDALHPYTENIPEANTTMAPCDDPMRLLFPVTANMSCYAREYGITVAFELYDLKPCSPSSDPHCPADGRYQYNAELVLGPDGTILARYYKENEWFPLRKAIDMPIDQPLISFVAPFGVRFGIFMCFDIMFRSPAVELVETGITHFVYSVAMDARVGKEVHRAWSERHGAVLLSSNLSQEWSGIFDAGVELPAKRVAISGSSDSILVATVSE